MKKRLISIISAFAVLVSAFAGTGLSVFAAKNVAVVEENTLYEWDMADSGTFWSVAGEPTPLNKTNGENDACIFNIDENGAYMKPKAQWVAFMTTGACSSVDLTDTANTDIVVDYYTPVATSLILKIDITAGDGDNFVECFNQGRTGSGTIQLNIKDLLANKFGDRQVNLEKGYISIQFMTTTGAEGAAVTWKSARVVRYEKKDRQYDTDVQDYVIKDFNLVSNGGKGTDIADIHSTANPTYSDEGISMNGSLQWVGITTAQVEADISDPATKLVAEITNTEGCSVAYKLSGTAIATRSESAMNKELSVNSQDGKFEIYLNEIFSEKQLKTLSQGKISIGILLGSTGKPVTLKSLRIVKEIPKEGMEPEEFYSFSPVNISSATGSDPVLPSTVRVTTVTGRTAQIAVTWEKPEGYSSNVPGTYTFTAVLDEQSLNDNAVIYDPDIHGAVTAQVTLIESVSYFELPVNNSAGWSKNGTDQYGTYTFDKNGLTITPSSLLSYTNTSYTVENVNMDVVKGISYNITANGGKWAIKVRNATTGDPQISSGEFSAGGSGFYDFSDQNWTGTADLVIDLFCVGADKSVTYHSVALDKKPVPKDSVVIDTTSPEGWMANGAAAEQSGENESGAYSFTEDGLSLTSKGAYYSISYTASYVNLDKVKGLLYYIDAPNARWEIKIANLKLNQEIQIGGSWDGNLGTSLDYFDFSGQGWTGNADIRISVFIIISGSDDTCVFKSLQLLQSRPDPMPEIPKEPALTTLTPDLTDYTEWSHSGKKLESASGNESDYEYKFTDSGLWFKSKIDKDGITYTSLSASYSNVSLDELKYLYYKVSTPSAERWDVKIYNLSKLDENQRPEVVSISGVWNGIGGSDEGYFSLPASWIGACDIKIELFTFTSVEYTGGVNFLSLDFKKSKPASPDSVIIDFSDPSQFSLSGGAKTNSDSFENKYGSYKFGKDGMTMSANRFEADDGSMQFWSDATIKIKNIDFSKTDTIEFDVGLTHGSWTIQVQNLVTGEWINYSAEVKPSDQAWSGVDVPKNSFFNFVKAAENQLGSKWSGNADIIIKFQALNTGKGSNVVFRSAKVIKGPTSVPLVTEYEFDFSDYEGWVIENEGLVIKPTGTTSNKVATYSFSSAGLNLKTETQTIDGANIFYTKFSYQIDNVDFSKLNAMTFDVLADNARWDIAVFCSTAPAGQNQATVSDGQWNGTSGTIAGTKSFKEMGWSGVGTLTVQIIGLDQGESNEIFVRALSLGTGETTLSTDDPSLGTAEEIDLVTIKCPTLDAIADILADGSRFDKEEAVTQPGKDNTVLYIIIVAAVVVACAAAVTVLVIVRKKRVKLSK